MIPLNNKYVWKLLLFAVVGFIVFSTISTFYYQKKIRGYEEITGSLTGIIKTITPEKSCSLIELEGDKKIFLPSSDNYSCPISELNLFLRIGDSITKNKDSDTLLVFRKSEMFFSV